MTNGEAEILDGKKEFAIRRKLAKLTPTDLGVSAPVFHIPFVAEQETTHPSAEEIESVYTAGASQVVDLLEEHGYSQQALKLREICLEAIWSGDLDDTAVKELAETALKRIDPDLYAFALGKPDLSDSSDTL